MFCRNFRLGILDDPSSRWFNTSNQKNCRQTSEVFCCLWNCDYCHVSYRHQTCCFRGATIFTNINMRQSKHPCLLLLPYANLVTQCRFFSFFKKCSISCGHKSFDSCFFILESINDVLPLYSSLHFEVRLPVKKTLGKYSEVLLFYFIFLLFVNSFNSTLVKPLKAMKHDLPSLLSFCKSLRLWDKCINHNQYRSNEDKEVLYEWTTIRCYDVYFFPFTIRCYDVYFFLLLA